MATQMESTASYSLPARNQWSFSRHPGVTKKSMVGWLFGSAVASPASGDDGDAGYEHQGGKEGGAGVL